MRHQRISQEEWYSSQCSMTSLVDQKTTKKNVWQMPNSFLYLQEDLEKDNGHSLILVLRKSGALSVSEDSPQGLWDNSQKHVGRIRRKRMSNFPCYEPIVQMSTQKQRTWKTVDTLCSRLRNGLDYFSHTCLCKSAQSLRSSRGDM